MKKITRREFIKSGVLTAGTLGTPLFFIKNAEKSVKSRQSGKIARVATIRGHNLAEMTCEALEALGGIANVINEGDTVFIKPNFVTIPWARQNNCFRAGECTKPEIIITVAEECLKARAHQVIIGEGSHLPRFDWQYAVTLDGETNLVKEVKRLNGLYPGNVSLACLEVDSPGWVEIPSQTAHQTIALSSLVTNADKIISIPVAKTHSWAQLTLATKNFLGITPLSRYAQLVDNTWWNRGSFDHSSPQAIAQVYLDIVRAIKPHLTIIDFSIGIEGDGPTKSWGGTTIDLKERIGTWAVIAGTDIMAADATAARMMNHNPQRISQLTMGFAMGLGEIREEAIEIIGEKIDNLRTDWKIASLKG
jgi:uncharacterized protein (DUF362 family)